MSTSLLPTALHTQDQARALDRLAMVEGTPGATLMQRAGRAAFELLRECWPGARRLAIYCGAGNNGGDAYVVAKLALDAGLVVYLHQACPTEKLQGDALLMAQAALKEPALHLIEAVGLPEVDVIVDGLLGIGISGPPRDAMAALIRHINASAAPVFALDLPSGLDGDTGHAAGEAVQADVTLTFIAVKKGLMTGQGRALAGRLYFDDLQLPERLLASEAPTARLVRQQDIKQALPPRRRDAHKVLFGHVLLVGGDHGYGGAIIMAAQAVLRAGAGLVSVVTRPVHVQPLLARQPEVMARGVDDPAEIDDLLACASVVVLGPGLGQSDWSRALFARLLESNCPQLLDADALNLLAATDQWQRREDRVITPHPGEAARLLGTTTAVIAENRFDVAARLQQRFGGVALLKGAGTLVAASDMPLAVVTSGNPGMATGGMGDVLSGIIGGLLAQGLSTFDAARLGALVHGLAADAAAARQGERGLAATDLLPFIPPLLNGLAG